MVLMSVAVFYGGVPGVFMSTATLEARVGVQLDKYSFVLLFEWERYSRVKTLSRGWIVPCAPHTSSVYPRSLSTFATSSSSFRIHTSLDSHFAYLLFLLSFNLSKSYKVLLFLLICKSLDSFPKIYLISL